MPTFALYNIRLVPVAAVDSTCGNLDCITVVSVMQVLGVFSVFVLYEAQGIGLLRKR